MQTAIFVSAVFLTFVVDPNQHVFKKNKNGRTRLPQHWTEIHFFGFCSRIPSNMMFILLV